MGADWTEIGGFKGQKIVYNISVCHEAASLRGGKSVIRGRGGTVKKAPLRARMRPGPKAKGGKQHAAFFGWGMTGFFGHAYFNGNGGAADGG